MRGGFSSAYLHNRGYFNPRLPSTFGFFFALSSHFFPSSHHAESRQSRIHDRTGREIMSRIEVTTRSRLSEAIDSE